MKPIQHLVWVGGRRHLDRRTGRSRYVASTSATAWSGTRTYLLDVAVNRRRQRWRIDKRCRPSPLLDVLALNVGKDRVQRTSEKFACRLDARSCGIEKVGRRYLVAGSLIRKSKRVRSGQLGPHRSLVSTAFLDERKCLGLRSPCGRSLPLPFSLGDALAEEEAKALAKGSSFLQPHRRWPLLARQPPVNGDPPLAAHARTCSMRASAASCCSRREVWRASRAKRRRRRSHRKMIRVAAVCRA